MDVQDLPPEVNAISGAVLDSALRVHSVLGPGLLERVYKLCLARELRKRGHRVEVEVQAPIVYEGERIEAAYRIDLLVDERVIVEEKAVDALHPIHFGQLWTYLKLTQCPVGLLVNFNVRLLKEGFHRVVL